MSSERQIYDRDTAVTYFPAGGWLDQGVRVPVHNEISRTGAFAIVQFEGTGIRVMGTIAAFAINSTSPTSTYILDDDITTYTPFRGRQNQTDIRRRITFYEISDLPHGQHNLTITDV
ncbi:hypothetical protein FA15DRAFT_44551 [Coprinopsis marcescibilis]|uniref:Uncharacterized protein n=1 Tax=Coprinopsis marcescibilis TaxID=230819 RepID=A0A5C3KQ74_COPMA|nr:hypothetical protein FA15DRAFT_44551 [Coprinopsis marcescibilis]